MSSYASQLHEEQQAVDRAYGRLDDLRAEMWQRLDTVRAAGSHGSPTQRSERDSFATMYENRLTQLRSVEDRLVFGRLDAKNGDRHYIGRIGLSSPDHEPILTDWRAEAARPFYEATPSNHGDIVMRRHITLSFREVVGVEDEVLDVHSDQVGQASSAGTLTGEGALLASLSSRRTGKMTDIVATIQAEQDRIIRSDMNRAVVVQGGPGTGKTAVALHRAAYLLYTHRRTLERSGVLVIGPSSTFLHYIDQVLPSLGETGVVSRTIADLIPGVIATGHDDPRAAKLKGERRMAKAIANASIMRAVEAELKENADDYKDLISLQKGENGEVSAVMSNIVKINQLKARISERVQENLTLDLIRVSIPLGNLIGGDIFSGRGPGISFKLLPYGNVVVDVSNEFTSAGINQTLHQLNMIVSVDVSVLVMGETDSFTIHSEVVVAETVIIGDVPSTYLQTGGYYGFQREN